MSERRMFTQKIVDSDAFLDMPLSAQCLYFHLNMRADDDGFVNNPRKIQRMLGASDDDLKLLLAKRFILGFASGVIVIKHWRMHNLLRKDRYNPTQYQDEFKALELKENGAYTESGNLLATTWQPAGNQMAPQDSIGKVSIDKYKPPKGGAGGKEIDYLILEYTDKAELQDALFAFSDMRKRIKKPLTKRAMQIVLGKLKDMGDEKEQVAIVNQSIEHSWQTVYPLKGERGPSADIMSHDWDYAELQKLAERNGM